MTTNLIKAVYGNHGITATFDVGGHNQKIDGLNHTKLSEMIGKNTLFKMLRREYQPIPLSPHEFMQIQSKSFQVKELAWTKEE